MAKQEIGRVVVRRKRAYGEGHHGGSWKIAYADFMTAMMAFFLVMWLVLLVPKSDLASIAEYFRMPLKTAITGGPSMDTSRSVIPGGSPSVIPNQHPLPSADQESDEDREDTESLENLKLELENLIEHNPVLQQFRPQLLLDMTPDGLRIQILDQQNRPMFNTGSAVIQNYMRDILRELAPPINQLPNSITISGHTDAMRYASGDRNYSNWELSADRANSARRELVAGSLMENKVKRILGLGDTVNLIKEDPFAAVNRRISILVLNRRAERLIDRQNEAGVDSSTIRDRLERLSQPGSAGSSPATSAPGLPPGTGTLPGNGQEHGFDVSPDMKFSPDIEIIPGSEFTPDQSAPSGTSPFQRSGIPAGAGDQLQGQGIISEDTATIPAGVESSDTANLFEGAS